LTERDFNAYRRVFELLVGTLPRPDLLLYLQAPVPVLMARIQRRARSIETGLTADYLSLLESYYEEWLGSFNLCPVLTIRSDDLDFVHKPAHLDIVVNRIQDRLAGKEDLVF
jgi:deoxyadenosine/deoxycytidine kinase